MRCAAITRGGNRCKLDATHGEYCWSHSPRTASERRVKARKGGKAGGNGRPGVSEIVAVKGDIRDVISGVLSGSVEKGAAAVAFQGFNALLKAVELERRVYETDQLAAELEELKRDRGAHDGHGAA